MSFLLRLYVVSTYESKKHCTAYALIMTPRCTRTAEGNQKQAENTRIGLTWDNGDSRKIQVVQQG